MPQWYKCQKEMLMFKVGPILYFNINQHNQPTIHLTECCTANHILNECCASVHSEFQINEKIIQMLASQPCGRN